MAGIQYIMSQGATREEAEELAEVAEKNPKLLCCTMHGKFIRLRPPVRCDLDRVNEMLASGSPPQEKTDRGFLSGSENGRQFEKNPKSGDFYKKACEKAGGSIKGKRYISQLAKFPGDPKAWVSNLGDVKKVCEERNFGCEEVGVKQRDPDKEPPPPKPIADHLVHRETMKRLEGQKVSGKEYRRKFHETKEKITPPWKK